jgi:hypothetical protein
MKGLLERLAECFSAERILVAHFWHASDANRTMTPEAWRMETLDALDTASVRAEHPCARARFVADVPARVRD